MFKQFFRLPLMALAGSLLLSTSCVAKDDASAPYTEGSEYVTLPAPFQRYSDNGKVEVAEVFSYGCIHCAQFAPVAEKLRKELPAGVSFELVPAPFDQSWLPFARAYYAAKQLGVVDRTHLKLFAAKYDEHYPINTLDELADFYAREGVDRDKFLSIAKSPEATAQLKSNLKLIQHWQVDGTPAVVVNGKYRITGAHSLEEVGKVALWLAKRELKQKK